MKKTNWKRLTDVPIVDLKATLLSDIDLYKNDHELVFYVGCDSQVHSNEITYTRVITMLRKGHGGLCYYSREKEAYDRKTMRSRLWDETYRTVELAKMVDETIVPLGYIVSELHVDLNPDKKHKSNEVVAQCLGYITSMGYNGKMKPDSWCSSKVADRKTK